MIHTRVILPIDSAMSDFVTYHPCEVYDGDGQFHSRYYTMLCAANTMLFINGSEVRDATPGALDPIWNKARCVRELNRMRRRDWSSFDN